MMVTVAPAFAQAELEYRQRRIKAGFPARRSGSVRRARLAALFKPRHRTTPEPRNAAPRLPVPARPAPHHLTSGT
jgi:hypothetical protein